MNKMWPWECLLCNTQKCYIINMDPKMERISYLSVIPGIQRTTFYVKIRWLVIEFLLFNSFKIESIMFSKTHDWLFKWGGSSTWRRSKLSFLLLLTEGSVSYLMLFTGSKILFLAEVIKFWNPEKKGSYSTCAKFKCVFPKMDIFGTSKFIFYIFWDKCMELGSCVLGTKTKLLSSRFLI